MATPFKMKGYSYPGKSPVKQKVDPDAPGTPGTPGYEPKVKSMDYLTKTPVGPRAMPKISPAKPAVRPKFKSPAKQVKGNLPKDFNVTGDKASTTPKYNIKKKGNFNFTGDSKSTTPKYSTTKAAKTQNFRDAANKIKTVSSKTNKGSKVVNAFKNTPKQYVKGSKEMLKTTNRNMISASKQVVKKALRGAGRLAGGLGVVAIAYDAYKSGQKHSGGKAVKGQKSFMADAKKNTKSIYKKK